MSFSINTNIASLQAQENLRMTSDFQAKTINRVTSGLRIVNSGDDAAGLAIANGYRSDISVLTQGVRNANDGISLLQIIDGGMNNISQLLDRARTQHRRRHAVEHRRLVELHERVGVLPVTACGVATVDQGDVHIGVVEQRVGEGHPHRPGADDEIVGVE